MEHNLDAILHDKDVEEDRFELPPHSRCAAHLLNLLSRKDVDMALEDSTFKAQAQSSVKKLQSLFNKQSRSPLNSEKIKELLGKLILE